MIVAHFPFRHMPIRFDSSVSSCFCFVLALPYRRFRMNAAICRRPSGCVAKMQQLTEARRFVPAFCSGSLKPVDLLLHFAAAHRGPSICSCILQRLIEARRFVPAFCSSSSTTFNEFLHFCNGHRRPSMSSCIFATAIDDLQ